MAIYGFRCSCGLYVEVERPMADATLPNDCACGKQMQRVFHTPIVSVRPNAGELMSKALSGEEVPPSWTKEKTKATAKSMIKK